MAVDILKMQGPVKENHQREPIALRLVQAKDSCSLPVSLIGSALCLAIGLIHIQDQGGFFGNETPLWMALGYYAVEVSAAVTIPFLIRQKVIGWVLAAGISSGPFVAYILSRSVGLPGDPGDVGNWGYTLGTVSLGVEGTLFMLSLAMLRRNGLGQIRGVLDLAAGARPNWADDPPSAI